MDTVALLEKLIGFDTTSRYSNLELVHFVQQWLEDQGIPAKLIFNDDKSKANLMATIGPEVPGGVVLSGHTDVVPVDGQDWTTEPFTLTREGDRLIGRGTADMKGFIASALSHVPLFKAAGLKRPVHFALSYDEEVGCLGVQSMVRHMKGHLPTPRAVIVGEPTSMQVAAAHKGQHVSRTHIWGKEAHSSRPEDGVNAVAVAAELIQFLTGLSDLVRTEGVKDALFDPPYTSFNIGPIQGGSAFNIIPGKCEFDWEFRSVPGENAEEIFAAYQTHIHDHILPKMRARYEGSRVENEVWAYLPPLKAEPGSDAETLALSLAEKNETTVVAFGTEAGHFQGIDYPTIVCGPGDIAQAHKPDEFITVQQLEACDRFMKRLAESLSAS